MLGFVLGLFVLILLFFVVGWIRLNRIDGRVFVPGQSFFYTVFDGKFVEQSSQGNTDGLSGHIGVGPTGYEGYRYFSGVIFEHDRDNRVVELVGRGVKIRLSYRDDFVARFLDVGQPLPVQTRDVVLLEKSIAKGKTVSVLFNDDFVIDQFVFIRDD